MYHVHSLASQIKPHIRITLHLNCNTQVKSERAATKVQQNHSDNAATKVQQNHSDNAATAASNPALSAPRLVLICTPNPRGVISSGSRSRGDSSESRDSITRHSHVTQWLVRGLILIRHSRHSLYSILHSPLDIYWPCAYILYTIWMGY